MKNITKEQLRKSIFMRLSDFEEVIENAIPGIQISYCEEILFYNTDGGRTVEQKEIYDELSKYFDVYVTSVHADSNDDVGVWIIYKEKQGSAEVPCGKCYNSRFDCELTDDNDFSSYTIGCSEKNYRMLYSSGHGQPPRILFESWNEEQKQWITVGKYFPKHCPDCGREINEYKEGREWQKKPNM